jgi:hypothetical protein
MTDAITKAVEAIMDAVEAAYIRGAAWMRENPEFPEYVNKAARDYADAALTALQEQPAPAGVKGLEWHRSHVSGWNGDYHTVPTGYTVRCADENGWRWNGLGAHGYASSPEGAMRNAQAHHESRILSALQPSPAREEAEALVKQSNPAEDRRRPFHEQRSYEDREAFNMRVHGLSEDDV